MDDTRRNANHSWETYELLLLVHIFLLRQQQVALKVLGD